ncbi:4'-phosphopantetheinyl transferase family protein [Pedobacter heparinus]|uniref:4'-phosphopantetheinyl transferase family protein n=1 Tax=Pedobacter heparinus TaxID=984 RepID=UPI002931C6EA|nr:4'-phosphopantetheinyl transferase superfamily protein [Pedobacter heparinus]
MDVLLDVDIKWNNYREDQEFNINHVNIFKLSVDMVHDQIASIYTKVLSENELMKADRFLHIEDKKRFIVSKYMLRKLLSKFISIPPGSIQFELSHYKKPFITTGIEFNTTYSKNIVLIAIHKKPVGIDVEFVNKDFNYKNLILTVFNKQEQLLIDSGLNSLINFYLLWTRKEAVLKATGEGLNDELNQIDILQPVVTRNAVNFSVKSLWIDGSYIMSLTAENNNDQIYYWNYE